MIELGSRGVLLAVGIVGASLGLSTLSSPNTSELEFTISAIANNRADCSDRQQSIDRTHLYDAIVVPGAGVIKNPDGTFELGQEAKGRLDAAAIAFSHGLAPRFVLLDGVGSQQDSLMTVRHLQSSVTDLIGDSNRLPEADILVESTSINTATNMGALAEISKDHNLRRVLLITNRYHQLRATLLACLHGIATAPLSAEDILIESDSKLQSEIDKTYTSWRMFRTRLKEGFEVFLLLFDPKGNLPTIMKRMEIYISPR